MASLLDIANNELLKIDPMWTPQEWEGRDMDSLQETYKGMEVRLAIPNGGIIGVSIWDIDRKKGWFLPTDLLPDHQPSWYHDADVHANFGKQAIESLRQTLQPWNPGSHAKRRRTKTDGEYQQLTLADALADIAANPPPKDTPPLSIGGNRPNPAAEHIPAVVKKTNTAKPDQAALPPAPRFHPGDVVIAISGRELASFAAKPLSIVGLSQLGCPLIEMGHFPPAPINPRNCRLATTEDMQELVSQVTPAPTPAPTQTEALTIDGRPIMKEWRYWQTTQQWTDTGAMGITLQARHPNSGLFPVDIDPNQLETAHAV